jgi:hypothetical protein
MFASIKRYFQRKRKYELGFTNEQVAALQRLSGQYLLRLEDATRMLPEISQELEAFFCKKGEGWEWFPDRWDGKHLREQVHRNPRMFELENTIPDLDGHNVEFRLSELGIRSMRDGSVLCRAKLYVYKEKSDEELDEFLAELAKI